MEQDRVLHIKRRWDSLLSEHNDNFTVLCVWLEVQEDTAHTVQQSV